MCEVGLAELAVGTALIVGLLVPLGLYVIEISGTTVVEVAIGDGFVKVEGGDLVDVVSGKVLAPEGEAYPIRGAGASWLGVAAEPAGKTVVVPLDALEPGKPYLVSEDGRFKPFDEHAFYKALLEGMILAVTLASIASGFFCRP